VAPVGMAPVASMGSVASVGMGTRGIDWIAGNALLSG
jgi:hypothetical protein